MERRIRALKAIILVIIMVMELFGTDALRAVAEEIVEIDTIDETQEYSIDFRTIYVTENGKMTGKIVGSGGKIINDGEINSVTSDGTAITNNKKISSVTVPSPVEIVNDNNGTIGELSVFNGSTDKSSTINMKSGTITTVNETGNGNTTYNLEGGTIGTFTASGTQASKVAIKGAMVIGSFNGNIALSGEGKGILTITQNLSISDSYSGELITVNKDTNITVPAGKTVQVTCDETDFTLSGVTGKTLTEAKGNAVTAELAAATANTMTVKTPFPAEKQLRSKTPVITTYQAKKGYYFPENYSVSVSDTTAATAGVVRSEDAATITVKVTIKSDGNNIVVTLPAATEKETPAAPTGLSGGVGKISGVTNAMEYSKDPNAKEWNAIGGISDFGTGEINDLEAGDWYVRYKETATTNASVAQTVKVKGIGKATVAVKNVSYGMEPEPNAVSETNTGEKAKIEYKKASEDDTTYSQTVPTAVGNYTVRATFAETEAYGEAVATTDFSIKYLETPEPPYTLIGTKGENAYYTSEVTVTPADGYQISKTLDGTYQDTLVIKETMAASDIYLVKKSTGEKTDAVVLQAINIDTADPILNVTNGETYKVKSKELEVTDANLSSVTINGAAQSVSGQSFKMNLEESVNPYVIVAQDAAGRSVKVTISVKTEEKTMKKEIPAPSPAYTLSGTKGENGYYTSNVVVKPAKGYMISTELNGTYVESLTIQNSQSGTSFYLKNASGERTGALRLETIKIKKQTPKLSLENGKTYYGDSVELVIKDACLEQVYLNGVLQNLNGTELILQLGSNNGKKKYEITAVDVAGNKKTILVTVAAAWMKTGIIPEGVPVNLETGSGYKLGTGNWKVQGDSTSYSGGTDFYVKKDGSYTFGKQ
ncbi:hypothetical protein [Eubacterium sp. MSJ-33]|uniref:hypothetical protein n=1 Tax=Eubacterium sp. MSJ-33 TaxID=2841528 RepID=UPI001C760225|nr:hypothetical protein [Eubacterium sp. MSJ-33]QWT52885.1 hypothetical protein KP625_12605 [Eubacterium sp. MSJ-33]